MNTKKNEWDNSYINKNNYVFYPHEEVVRFISKYIRKKTGRDSFSDQNIYEDTPKVLDFGCGIGRHVALLNDFNLDVYGFDLSSEAIKTAKLGFELSGQENLSNKLIVSDITNLPYMDKKFDYMLSHGVLDSMPFNTAKKGLAELHRVLKKDGLIYFDLIDSLDSSFNDSPSFEKEVDDEHERGTIQSYFNMDRINKLLSVNYKIIECYKIQRKDCLANNGLISRYHLVVKKI